MDQVKVAGVSRVSAVAGAIAGIFRQHNRAEALAIGAGAVNQAVKAIIVAKKFLQEEGVPISFTAVFVDIEIDEIVKTGIKFIIEPVSGDLGVAHEQEKAVQE
jgi:Uncharacterized protein conserved in bacteria